MATGSVCSTMACTEKLLRYAEMSDWLSRMSQITSYGSFAEQHPPNSNPTWSLGGSDQLLRGALYQRSTSPFHAHPLHLYATGSITPREFPAEFPPISAFWDLMDSKVAPSLPSHPPNLRTCPVGIDPGERRTPHRTSQRRDGN